ncbi:MAG TPA: T9SS type A sorting domain-containing protein [Saprospiraceae bacterium]|nr:T9SS type A sorting domain-containing protein [Saprospiraceae bacterium]HMP23850.1 T9SS type A sorting domain-containing protein [Saprospiraceae bacterium]
MKKWFLLLGCCLSACLTITAKNSTSTFDFNDQPVEFYILADTVRKGETLCMDFKTRGFSDIARFRFTIAYGRGILSEPALVPGALPGEVLLSAATNGNIYNINWATADDNGRTLEDDATLFQLCFTALQTTDGRQGVSIIRYPFPNSVSAHNGAGAAVPVVYAGADYAVLPSDAIALSIGDTVITPGSAACMPVRVDNFDGKLIAMQFSMAWDTAILRLDSIINLGMPNANLGTDFNLGMIASGRLSHLWLDSGTFEGVQLDPGSVFFELCFTTKSNEGAAAIRFTESPTPFEFLDSDYSRLNFDGRAGSIAVSEDPIVYPGDTNRDGLVNHFDLLNIGLGYGTGGPQRPQASANWTPQPAADWPEQSPLSQINFKHIDTDGNGWIEWSDATIIEANWNSTVEDGLTTPQTPTPRENGPPLYVQTALLQPGLRAAFDIILGNEELPATDCYGLAFSITYDPEALGVDESTVEVQLANNWLGTINEDLLVIQRHTPAARRIDVALVRADGQNRSGHGTLGQIVLETYATTTSPEVRFKIENVRMINFAEEPQPVAPAETSATIELSTSAPNLALAQQIEIFPNPTSEQLFLRAGQLQIWQIECFDTHGRLVQRYANTQTLPVQALAPGHYYLRIATDAGVAVKRFVVQ